MTNSSNNYRHPYFRWPSRLVLLLLWLSLSRVSLGADHGVVLLYHHVSDSTPKITSVSPEQFEQHLNYLQRNNFNVTSLHELLSMLEQHGSLPENTVAITFDDAYASVYREAYPRLKKRNWPFTVFVAHEPVDRGYEDFMTWIQLREMASNGVEFGAHSSAHEHLVRRRDQEAESDWLIRVIKDIQTNVDKLARELSVEIHSIAWPYGEYLPALNRAVAELGLYPIGQQSGAIGNQSPDAIVPRFPMMFSMASLERLALAVHSRPLPLTNIDAGDTLRTAGEASGVLSFELLPGPYRSSALACYSADGAALPLDAKGARVIVTLPPFKPGRNKVNCTVPSTERTGEFFWHSEQWLVRRPDGSWYPEA